MRKPTPTVAKIAAEVAADLEDYVQLEQYGTGMRTANYTGYRTADAQEMIERAFAGLEAKPVSADVEQIVREVVERILNHSDSRQQCEQTVANAITAALAPSEKLIEELECKDTNHRVEITRLQAELEQARGEIAQIRHAAFPDGAPKGYNPDLSEAVKQVRQSSTQCAQRYAILSKTRERELDQHTRERADLQARLATAEAALHQVTDFNLSPDRQRNTESLIQVRQICREAIDQAKGETK